MTPRGQIKELGGITFTHAAVLIHGIGREINGGHPPISRQSQRAIRTSRRRTLTHQLLTAVLVRRADNQFIAVGVHGDGFASAKLMRRGPSPAEIAQIESEAE
jgi:hypothetical protein